MAGIKFVVFILILMDQLFKLWAYNVTALADFNIIPGVFRISYVENYGAAFNLFSGNRWPLVIVTGVLLLVIAYLTFSKKITDETTLSGLSMILAGGTSNLIDRVLRGYVVDCLDFTQLINFPVFNFADVCVVIGAGMLIYHVLIEEPRKKKAAAPVEEQGNEVEQVRFFIGPEYNQSRVDGSGSRADWSDPLPNPVAYYRWPGDCGWEASTKECTAERRAELCISIPDPVELEAVPQDIPVDIIYEDESVIVVNKPKGMVVHPAPGNPDGTLVNALLWHCRGKLSSINGVIRPGIVHRIDRDTSGLLLVAKTDQAHLSLSEQIKAHSCERVYQAVVYGRMKEGEGRVDAPIGRNPMERKEMCVIAKNSKEAVTNYRVLQEYEGFSHLELRLETGRTHQIRVHMAYLGHPVAGDPVYGPKKGDKKPGRTVPARKKHCF